MPGGGPRLFSPAAARNLGPLTGVLERFLPAEGTVAEVGSGPGQHVEAWAHRFPHLTWQPSDVSAAALASLRARADSALPNLMAPLELDLERAGWEGALASPPVAIVAVNVLHVAPWAVSVGLLRGSGRCLGPGGHLLVYGPFKQHGRHTAASNATFDAGLRRQDPRWGVRDVEELEAAAAEHALVLAERCPMPSNNLVLVFVPLLL